MRSFDPNKYTGLRYVAGGRDDAGVDCWGLLRMVYAREFDIELPGHAGVNADTTEDEDLAEYIAASIEDWERVRDPLPGDGIRLTLKGNSMHVGIVLGDGKFLHARADHDVAVEDYRSSRWASRIEGFYRYAPKSDAITVSGCPHPLRMSRIDGQAQAGSSLASVIYGHCSTANVPEELIQYGLAFVNGRKVVLPDWNSYLLTEGDRVEFRMLPGKEGGGLRMILMIAVMVVAAWASAGASAAWGTGLEGAAGAGAGTGVSGGFVGALAGMAVTMAGTALVNAIAPIRPPQIGSDDKGTSYKPQYMLAGGQNSATPYAAFPVVLGRHDFTAPLGANTYISSDGTDRYLHMLIIWGYGPLHVWNLRIGTTPIQDYDYVYAYTVNGDPEEYVDGKLDWTNPEVAALLNVYASDINQQSPEAELDTTFIERTTIETACTQLKILLTFPQGLVDIDEDDGRKQTETVIVVVEYRRIGYYNAIGDWVPVSSAWKGSWSNIPGLGWNRASDETGLDVKTIVVLRGNTLVAKTNMGGWNIQADGVVPANWPAVAIGETLIHKIQNGALVSSHNTELYTGFSVTFRTISRTVIGREWNSLFWVESPPVTYSYVQFMVTEGSAVGSHVYSNANNDPFDALITLDVQTEPGQYEVRLRRTTVSRADSMISDKVYWMMLTEEVQNRRPINPPKPMAMTAIRIKATNQLNGSLDGITASLASRQLVWDGTAWVAAPPTIRRNNPASLFLYLLQHPANAQPVADANIDFFQLGHWYDFCEEKGFLYENILTGQRPIRDVLADIAAAGRASIAMPDGKWSVVIDEPKATIVQHFTPHNSWGFEGTRLLPKLPHGLRVNFLNREKDYQPDEMIVYADGYSAANAALLETIELPGVTSAGTLAAPGPVYKLARFHMEQLILRPEEYSISTDIENLICTRGDRVKVMHDVPMWGLGSGRVKSVVGDVTGVVLDETVQMTAGKTYTLRWRTSGNVTNTAMITGVTTVTDTLTFTTTISSNKPAQGDLFMFGELNSESVDCLVKSVEPMGGYQAKLTLVDYAPAVFDAEDKPFGTWLSQITEPPLLMRSVIEQRPIIENIATDESALTKSGNAFQSNILIKFSTAQATDSTGAVVPISGAVDSVEFQYRLDSTVAVNVPFIVGPVVKLNAGSVYLPVEDSRTYDLRMRFIGNDGRNGQWLYLDDIYVSGKTNPPPYVENFKLIEQPGGIKQFFWDVPARPSDLFAFEVRFCLGSVQLPWDEMIPLFAKDHRASSHENTEPASDDIYTFAIRAVDTSGLMSALPHYITEVLDGDAFGMVERYVMPHELRWPGTKTDCVIVGPNLENTGTLTWDLADYGWDATEETWNNTAPVIVYEHSIIDMGSIASRTVRANSLVSGSTLIQAAYSSDGTTYTAFADVPNPAFSFRYLKTRWTVSGTNPAMYRAQVVIYS